MSKGRRLGELRSAGMRIPDFVLIRHDNLDTDLHRAEAFVASRRPDARFAVRSSAECEDGKEHSFAGIFETLVNVPASGISVAVEQVLASSRGKRAFAYAREIGMDPRTFAMNVVVQDFVAAQVSGIAFTRDPRNGERVFLIECALGLGELVVSGRTEVDRIIIGPCGQRVLDYQVGFQNKKLVCAGEGVRTASVPVLDQSRRKLPIAKALELCGQLVRIEAIIDAPADVEWGYRGEELFVFQARPLTTIPTPQNQ